MSRLAGRLLAVLLTASTVAPASLIPAPPQDVLEQQVERPDPSPLIGPKLHYTVGPEVHVYPRHAELSSAQNFAYIGLGLPVATAILLLIPIIQLLALLVRLLN